MTVPTTAIPRTRSRPAFLLRIVSAMALGERGMRCGGPGPLTRTPAGRGAYAIRASFPKRKTLPRWRGLGQLPWRFAGLSKSVCGSPTLRPS